ncbi:hypothetical protein AGMMS49543_11890 [Betaproteobacteria bacterium]|nr:hypothetical protein AGMMS49543_11890 [Betaproteobacteria bacterium]GHU21424.1 hypothetical protein AGMMS50243_19120 [Betaproteobacteria bacterium]
MAVLAFSVVWAETLPEETLPEPADYVRWIGDIDGDGKPDFVVNFVGNAYGGEHDFALFLSSLARPGEIVGLAGRFDYFPIDASGC